MARFSAEDRETIWEMREAGVPVKRIAKHLGRQNSSLRMFIADHGGTRPTARERSELRLSLEEREEISRGLAAGSRSAPSPLDLERSPSTVCREVNANGGRRSTEPCRPIGVPETCIAPEKSQAHPVPAIALDGRAQARGPVVTSTDLGVVG